jgi:hypothetical protein
MKAVLLKDITDETRNYRQGEIIDVYFDSNKSEIEVYHPYKKEGKVYKHWFNIVRIDKIPNFEDVKIIDTEGFDIEDFIKDLVDTKTKYINKLTEQLREVFNIA